MNNLKFYTKKKIDIMQLPSSDYLSIWEHHFVAKKPGNKFYLQANLHGPEVVGIGVLLKLIEIIKKQGIENGEIKIVVSANPIGLNSKIDGYQVGYKNLNSTKYSNWNRIFKQELPEKISDYGLQIEDKLAFVLQNTAKGFDTFLDVHSAQNNIEAIYTFPNAIDTAKTFDVPHVVLLNKTFSGCFDEAMYFSNQQKVEALTLELNGGIFNEEYLESWAQKIYLWILGETKPADNVSIWKFDFDLKYYAPVSGLILPLKNPGEKFSKGDTLVEILKINGKKTQVKALSSGVVFKLPLSQSVWEGEEVIEVFQKGKI